MRRVLALLTMPAALLAGAGPAQAQDRTHRIKARMALPILLEDDVLSAHRISGADRIRDPRLHESWDQLHLQVTIDPTGAVIAVAPPSERVNYPPVSEAALARVAAAIRQWRYRPFESHGGPMTVRGNIWVEILSAERLPARHFAFPEIRPAAVSITLVRRRPWSFSYRVTIHGDGRVDFAGAQLGKASHRYAIPVARVEALIAQFRAADFWSSDPRYELRGASDLPTNTLIFDTGNAAREVVEYGGTRAGMPDALFALEAAVDDAADSERWTVGNARTVPALKREGFDFASPEAADMFVGMIWKAPDAVLRDVLDQGVNLDLDARTGRCAYCRNSRTYREAAIATATELKRPVVLEWLRLKP